VVDYIEPMNINAAAIGYDIKSSPARAEAIQRATDTGEPAATAPVDLVQATGPQKGMLLLLPAFSGDVEPPNATLRRTQVEGFAVGVYELGNVLAATFDGPEWRNIALRMYDVTDATNPILLAEQGSTVPPDASNTSSITIDVAGRTWLLDVTPAPQVLGNPAAAPAYLLAGLLIIFLLQAFVLLVTGMERQARRQADASHYDASHDPLTELMNRRAFIERMSDVRLRSEDEGARHVLMYLDLDGFKAVNDRGGHEAGDRCLREIAQRFAQCVRGGDTVARLGGDEFAVILNDCPVERGLDVARQLVNAASSYRPFPNDPRLVVGVSIGVTTIAGNPPPSLDALLHEADTACYQAKREGKAHIRLFQPDAAGT
jgi:diguanylate cyclase (GGDEF)-like protein